jgi:Na+-driven multidrug efflux pump
MGVEYMQIAAMGYLPLSLCIVLGGAMVGALRARLTLALDVSVLLLAQVPLCLLAVSSEPPSFTRLIQAALAASTLAACAYGVLYATQRWLPRRG